GSDSDLGAGLALARRPLEGLGRGVQVARPVVDDGDALHRAYARAQMRRRPRAKASFACAMAVCDHETPVCEGASESELSAGGRSVLVGSHTPKKAGLASR